MTEISQIFSNLSKYICLICTDLNDLTFPSAVELNLDFPFGRRAKPSRRRRLNIIVFAYLRKSSILFPTYPHTGCNISLPSLGREKVCFCYIQRVVGWCVVLFGLLFFSLFIYCSFLVFIYFIQVSLCTKHPIMSVTM